MTRLIERTPIIGETIREIREYQATDEEKSKGLWSSVRSAGRIGQINRLIAKMTRQEEVDIIVIFRPSQE